MSEDEEEMYCRLCAEPTPKTQLITPEEEVAINSKIVTKLLWINIDISSSSTLPNTICFSCFDLLERTWSFLNNTRIAHEKLTSIFVKTSQKHYADSDNEKVKPDRNVAGKPVNNDWECFMDLKVDVKIEDEVKSVIIDENDSVKSCKLNVIAIKAERDSVFESHPDDPDSSDHNSSDSDVPLEVTAKKKRSKRKKVNDTSIIEKIKTEIPIEMLNSNTSWESQPCRCAKCDAQCQNITSLQLHSLQIHNHCCVFKCIDCAKVFNNFKAFVRHMRTHNKTLNHCCEFCNKLFLLASQVKPHRTKNHPGISSTKCKNCGSYFETIDELQEHKLLYGKRYKKSQKTPEQCELDLKCTDCDRVFKSRSNLQQHKLVHTERSRDFSCHICGKMFFTKGTLSTHMQTHEDTKPFKCDYCPLAFRARGNLLSHISLHSGAKPFVCEQCGKSFRVKRHLKSHSIVHTDLMPFVCEYCNKSFRFKTRLNLHLRQHTGAKPYNCIYCQRDFTNGSNYKKHMKRRHGMDTSKKKYNVVVSKEENDLNESMTQGVFTE